MSNKSVKIISITTYGNDRVVKIAVSCFESLLNYKPGTDEITVVLTTESCPEEDLKAIKAHCQQFDYSYEGCLEAGGDGGESSKGTGKDNEDSPTDEKE